jgi:hypothetical protein
MSVAENAGAQMLAAARALETGGMLVGNTVELALGVSAVRAQ